MRRRDFIAGLSGLASLPLVAQAQQSGRLRRIGSLLRTEADDIAFRDELGKLGWIEGRNLRIDVRPAADDPKQIRDVVMELIDLAPEVIVTGGGTRIQELRQQTKTIPIVFAGGQEPVSAGLMKNIARPDGNITGFVTVEASTFGKWIELLKEAMPRLARVSVIFHSETLRILPLL